MPRMPDLVRDSKLETRFHPRYTAHLHQEPDPREQRRTVTRAEYWKKVRNIGGGSYGQVWLEECFKGQRCHSLRAVKQIPKFGAMSKAIDYNRELEAMAKFSHHRYVRCFVESYGWFEQEQTLSISMEYFPHGDLRVYLQANEPLVENVARQITFQILEGLSFLHENGFTHRDLKPSNILIKQRPPLQESWWVKIADFGISKRAEDGTAAASTFKGTLGYMAPECHGFISEAPNGLREDAVLRAQQSVDMWALGEIAFQMLTKEPCFANLSLLAKFAVGTTSFPSVTLQKHDVSEAGISFISAAMLSSPHLRMGVTDAFYHEWMEPLRPTNSKPASLLSIESAELGQIPETLPFDEFDAEPSAAWSTVSDNTAIVSHTQGGNATTNAADAAHVSALLAAAKWDMRSVQMPYLEKSAASNTTQSGRLEGTKHQQTDTSLAKPFTVPNVGKGEKDRPWSDKDLIPLSIPHRVGADRKGFADRSQVSRFDVQSSSQQGNSKSNSSTNATSLPTFDEILGASNQPEPFREAGATSGRNQTAGGLPEDAKKKNATKTLFDRKLFSILRGSEVRHREPEVPQPTPSPPSPTFYYTVGATSSSSQDQTARTLGSDSASERPPASDVSTEPSESNDRRQDSHRDRTPYAFRSNEQYPNVTATQSAETALPATPGLLGLGVGRFDKDSLTTFGQGRYQLANDASPHISVDSQSSMITSTPKTFPAYRDSLQREIHDPSVWHRRPSLPRIKLLLFFKVDKPLGVWEFRSQLARAILCVLGENLADPNRFKRVLSRDQVTICIYFSRSIFGGQLAFNRMELDKIGLVEFRNELSQEPLTTDSLKWDLRADAGTGKYTVDRFVVYPRLYQYTSDRLPDADPVRPFLKSLLAFDHRMSRHSARHWMEAIAKDLNVPFAFSMNGADNIGEHFSQQWLSTLQSKNIQSGQWRFDARTFEIIDYKMTLEDKMALAAHQNAYALI